jgi:hypothetical protein
MPWSEVNIYAVRRSVYNKIKIKQYGKIVVPGKLISHDVNQVMINKQTNKQQDKEKNNTSKNFRFQRMYQFFKA